MMKHVKMTRIKDAYPNGFNGNGIFTDLQNLNVPWKTENIATSLDILYHARSNDKLASKIVYERMEENEPLTEISRQIIALSLTVMYGRNWQKLYDVLLTEYNPIENYRMTENETSTHSVDTETTDTGTDTTLETGTDTIANTGTKTIADTGTNTTTDTGTDTTLETGTDTIADTGTVNKSGNNSASNAVYGFNSSSAVNSDETSGINNDTETRNLEREETRNLSTQETRNLSTQETRNLSTQETRNLSTQETRNLSTQETRNLAGTSNETGENERELIRSGNIGVTTSQQLLLSEIELWQWQFFNQVFEDIDRIICLSVY